MGGRAGGRACGARRSGGAAARGWQGAIRSGRASHHPFLATPLATVPGVRGWDAYGSAWVSAQLVGYIFRRMLPATRRQLDARRVAWPHAGPGGAGGSGGGSGGGGNEGGSSPGGGGNHLVIGMHIRAGDSCHMRRYCPTNLTGSYFAAAARLRAKYGANRIHLATDSAEAAALCARRAAGLNVPSALSDDGAPSASLDQLKAPAAPTHPQSAASAARTRGVASAARLRTRQS